LDGLGITMVARELIRAAEAVEDDGEGEATPQIYRAVHTKPRRPSAARWHEKVCTEGAWM
jgi:hypothetical protein